MVMTAVWGLFWFIYNCIANLVSQWLTLHCSGLNFNLGVISEAFIGFCACVVAVL